MCQAIRELMEDARNDGIEQGIEKGIEQGIKSLREAMQELGADKGYVTQTIRDKFNLTEEKACSYVEKYWK